MTTDTPETPEPATSPFQIDFDKWRAEDAKRRAAFLEQLVGIKTRLFDFLEARGIVVVTVGFDGCGDSGQIEDIYAFDEHGSFALPDGWLAPAECGPPSIATGTEGEPVNDVIELLAYDLLECEHDGWEINAGAYGEFRFDVADRSITLGCHLRVETSEFFETHW